MRVGYAVAWVVRMETKNEQLPSCDSDQLMKLCAIRKAADLLVATRPRKTVLTHRMHSGMEKLQIQRQT